MFTVASYLSAIGYSGPVEPTAQTLRELHKRHMVTVPFDNSQRADLGTAVLNDVDVDIDGSFDRVVARRNGGVCFELSGMFRRLLIELGYEVLRLSSGVRGPSGAFGPDVEHMFLAVPLDGQTWLVDVGFAGPGFVEPVLLSEQEQEQHGVRYRVTGRDGYHVAERKTRNGDWQDIYRFTLRPRTLADWDGAGDTDADGWNWDGEIIAASTVIRARATDTGQLVLVGKRLVKVDDGVETVRVLIDPVEYKTVVADILGRDD
ncbi:arylamine N-acetyltransferase [Micromonospora sp. WMMD980]|uniref:Amide synthase n=1 Tax=Micromonospora sp. HK160111 TaxID=1245497 RepID=A0A2H4RBY6_9ACTN|nr:arylamine N-acetyltransferase [Micromonospora sp. WMMD980]ATY46593.1 amide synthase [Micromonospora sp. HK160111]MDG4800224.1 arylamine N-acetyltransferase [Micromonospora sp. WMMD980]